MTILSNLKLKILFQSDLVAFVLLFLVAAFFVYFLPVFFARIFFFLLLLLFWRSKKNYFWFAFVFILIEQPAGFFSGGLAEDMQRLPLYTIISGVSLTVDDLFIIAALMKALVKGKRRRLFFNKPLQWLFVYLILILFFSFLFGMNNEGIVRTLRVLSFWTLFISLPYLLENKDEMIKFCALLFPFIFLVFAGQLYELINGVPIIGVVKPIDPVNYTYSITQTDNIYSVARFISAPYLNLFCFISSLFIVFSRNIVGLSKLYLLTVATLCFLSIVLSATRGWFLAYTITILLIFITASAKPLKIAGWVIFPLLLFFALYSITPAFKIQINNAMVRISTLEGLAQGDITLGGTQQRTTIRSARVMEAFYKNPVTGWGFSYQGNHDGHVGNQNLLQSTGFIGYSLFLYFWLSYIYSLLLVKRRILHGNPYKMSLVVLLYGFIGIFVIHSTSSQMFGYDPQFSAVNKIFFLVGFFVFSDIFMKEALNTDVHLKSIREPNLPA
ncbi:MAG: hypothetical protein JXB49_33450 [Bacteroidales bacterium]|nr:hypothetical protein [Bacteroidales bacterium]